MFMGCTNLRTVTIPASIISTAYYSLYDCPSLTDIYCYGTTPPEYINFEWTEWAWLMPFSSFDAVLHVPEGCSEAYAMAEVWKNFNHIVEFTTAVSDIHLSAPAGTDHLYDLAGRKIANPRNDIYVKTVQNKNGQTVTRKVVMK